MKTFTKTNGFARATVAITCVLLLSAVLACPAFAEDKSEAKDEGTQTTATMTGDGARAEAGALAGLEDAPTPEPEVATPTLTKAVKQDSDTSTDAYETGLTDAQMGQETEFTLTGTVASDIDSYDSYPYVFSDELPEGLTLVTSGSAFDESDVTVKVDGTVVGASCYEASYTDNVLGVAFKNLKSVQDAAGTSIAVSGSSKVTVTYKAKLNSDAAMGALGNCNSATLSAKSTSTSEAETVVAEAYAWVYSFALNLVKVEKGKESTTLPNAKFTIQATDADDADSKGKYVQEDGTLGANPHDFVTDKNGSIMVAGLDAGTYTITETEAPSGFLKAPAITLTIAPSYDGELTDVNVTLSGGNADGADTDEDGVLDAGTRAEYGEDGAITLHATDKVGNTMPTTGQGGIAAVYAVGAVLFAVSAVAVLRGRALGE